MLLLNPSNMNNVRHDFVNQVLRVVLRNCRVFFSDIPIPIHETTYPPCAQLLGFVMLPFTNSLSIELKLFSRRSNAICLYSQPLV